MLLARLFESLPLGCPNCGVDMRIIAFIPEAAPIEHILTHIGEPPHPPAIAPARGPPAWDDTLEPMTDWDLIAQPDPGFKFDQLLATAVSCDRWRRRPITSGPSAGPRNLSSRVSSRGAVLLPFRYHCPSARTATESQTSRAA